MSRARLRFGKPSAGGALNTVAPSITGTRGGTLTGVDGTWVGSTSLSRQWYADGVATGNTTSTFVDSDTTKTIEFRVTALPGSVTASAWDGTVVTPPDYGDDFNSYADGTRLAQFLSNGTTQTATPHVLGYVAKSSSSDTNGTGDAQDMRIYSGKVQRHTANENGYVHWVRDMGSPGGEIEYTLPHDGVSDYRHFFVLSSNGNTKGIQIAARNGYPGSGVASSVSVMLDPGGAETPVANITGLPNWSDGAKLKARLDDAGKRIYLFIDNAVIGASGGYDLSAWAGPWTNFHGFMNYGVLPSAGQPTCDAIAYTSLQANSVAVALVAQPSGVPGKKQLNVTATIGMTGATGAEYKVETEAGALVQGWTAMAYASGTGTATYLIPDFSYEGQKLRVLARNVGGTVKIVGQLSTTNGYALQQRMRVGLNDSFGNYWAEQVWGRDIFEQVFMANPTDGVQVVPVSGGAGHDAGIIPPGATYFSYAHWEEAYNPAQLYPATSTPTDDNYVVCSLNGVQWVRTSHTPRSGVAPDPTDPNGTTSGWRRGYNALASVVGLNAAGRPTQLPTDTTLTVSFSIPWNGFKETHYPVTVHCKTEPGVNLIPGGMVGVSFSNQNLGAGTFDLTYTAAEASGSLKVDRTTPISSAFFLSGVPTYETGTPAADIGAPYPNLDKLSDFTPFWGRRNMTASLINRGYGAAQNSRTAANNVPAGGRRQWKYDVDLANRAGHAVIWVNDPDESDSTYRQAMATYYRDNLNSNILILLERSNELWLGKLSSNDLAARATANGVSALFQYSAEFKAMMLDWKAIFTGANASRLKGVQAWQSTISTTNWQDTLDYQSSYQHTSFISAAPYFGDYGDYASASTAMRNAVLANDQTAYNTALDPLMRAAADSQTTRVRNFYDWLPNYSVSKGLNKNAIGYVSYEAGHNLADNDPSAWDAALGAGMGTRATNMMNAYKRSATFGATEAYYIDSMATYCPHIMMLFDYVGSTAGQRFAWGHMERLGRTTEESYASAKARAAVYNV